MTQFYKVLHDGNACHGGTFAYPLPKGGRKGKWTPRITDLKVCQNGFHVCTAEQLPAWLYGGNQVWEVEVRGATIEASDKLVAESVRLVRRLEHGEAAGVVLIASAPELLVVKPGQVGFAVGASRVELRENSTATLWGNSTATLRENSTATLWENSTATLRENSTATLWGNSTATKYSYPWGNAAKVKELFDKATFIDRSGGKFVIHTAVPAELIVAGDAS